MNQDEIDEQWKNLLTPEILRTRLITCSIYLTAYHLLKSSVVDRLRGFFMEGIADGKITVSADYATEVLSRNRSPVHASLDWLKENKAISDEDIALFGQLTKRRNEISHALHTNLLEQSLMGEASQLFDELRSLLKKIEVWWIISFDLALTDEIPEKVEQSDITPGPVIMLDLLIGVALGPQEEANSYLEGYLRIAHQ